MSPPLLVYGAYGYTGALIARTAAERGLPLVLGGRDSERLAALARELDCPWRAFPLTDPTALRLGIEDAAAVIHCAGPFATTYRPMAEACLEARVHYLDITGEVPVFQGIARMGPHAERAGVMLLPGAGFDVVPTDCLAAHLAARLPGAVRLTLAFQGLTQLSIGTARTMTRPMPGRPAPRGSGAAFRRIDLGGGPVLAAAIPWGDVFTAPHTTGIQDVTVYTAVSGFRQAVAGVAALAARTLRTPAVQETAARLIAGGTSGPDLAARGRGGMRVWGEAVDRDGRRVEARLRTPNGYTLTAHAAVELASRVLSGDVHPGWQTPASAYGPDLVLALPGVKREDVG
jgi:short subunit dehydrogenase-like uncharacterized protein